VGAILPVAAQAFVAADTFLRVGHRRGVLPQGRCQSAGRCGEEDQDYRQQRDGQRANGDQLGNSGMHLLIFLLRRHASAAERMSNRMSNSRSDCL